MEKSTITETLKRVRANTSPKKFKQSVDLIVNLQGLDLKKPDHQINLFVSLPHPTGRKVSVGAFVGTELKDKAADVVDEVIEQADFEKLNTKAKVKKLANKHDFFIAQANIMAKIASSFGRVLGPRGKMPNPKVGAVIPPNANVKALYDKLKQTIQIATKNEQVVKCIVGKEEMSDDDIADNVLSVYNTLVAKLPNDVHSVKTSYLKLTMGPAFLIGGKEEAEAEPAKGKKPSSKKEAAKPEAKEAPKAEEQPAKKPEAQQAIPKKEAEKAAESS